MRQRTPTMALALLFAACDSGGSAPADTVAASTAPPRTAPSETGASTAPSGSAKPPPEPAAPARQLYYERPIADDDLKGRTLRELALLRNTIYARAGNPFRRPWLNEYFSAQPWYHPKDTWDESKLTELDRKNARRIADYDAAITHEDLEHRRDEVVGRQKAGALTPEDTVELSLLSQRLGTWLGDPNAPKTPIEDQTMLDRLLKVEELSTLSRRDLRILRNTVYARHGRSFDSAVVRDYFKGAAWYKPMGDYSDDLLTKVDIKNIAIIRSVEDSLGGPLHENPNYGKDGWFIAA